MDFRYPNNGPAHDRVLAAARRGMHLPVSWFCESDSLGLSAVTLAGTWLAQASHMQAGGPVRIERTAIVFGAVLGVLIEDLGFSERTFWDLANAATGAFVGLPARMVQAASSWSAREVLSSPWRPVVHAGLKSDTDSASFLAEVESVRHGLKCGLYDGYDPLTAYDPLLRGFAAFARHRLWLIP